MGMMVRRIARCLFVFVFLLCTACSTPVHGPSARVAGGPDTRLFSEASWGVLARSLKDGRVIWAKDEKLHFSPASNLKLFTTAVGLLRLGPDYRYTTTLWTEGETRTGILHGDLVVRASGDPSLCARFRKAGAVGIFEEWAGILASQGIREVQGDIVIDESVFDAQYMGTGWFWDDEHWPYSAQISAFSINDNCVELKVSANSASGEPGLVEVVPKTGYVTIVNQTMTTESDQSSLTVGRRAGSNTIVVSGTVSFSDSPRTLMVTVHRPSLYGATVLKETLASKGIIVHGRISAIDENHGSYEAKGRVLASYGSPPLTVIVDHINKRSHNLSAELLLRTLGAVCYGKGSARNGVRVIEETLQRAGVVPEEIRILDGSGLSRLSLVTPTQMVNLLEFVYHQPVFTYFYDSLPIAGVDGTLGSRMVGTAAEKNVRAKTGSATHIGCLSGYLRRKDGEMIAFSVMTNNNLRAPSETGKPQDAFCEWLSGR